MGKAPTVTVPQQAQRRSSRRCSVTVGFTTATSVTWRRSTPVTSAPARSPPQPTHTSGACTTTSSGLSVICSVAPGCLPSRPPASPAAAGEHRHDAPAPRRDHGSAASRSSPSSASPPLPPPPASSATTGSPPRAPPPGRSASPPDPPARRSTGPPGPSVSNPNSDPDSRDGRTSQSGSARYPQLCQPRPASGGPT